MKKGKKIKTTIIIILLMSLSNFGCDILNFKEHTINWESYLKIRREVINNQYNSQISANCLSEILYCLQLCNDRRFADTLSELLLKQKKIFWAKMFEIIAKDIDERTNLIENIQLNDIPSDEDHIKIIFSLCSLRDVPKVKKRKCKEKLMSFYEDYMQIFYDAEKNTAKTCKNCEVSLYKYQYCDYVSTVMSLKNYYEDYYLFTKENEGSCYTGMGTLSIWSFKNHILIASLNSWHNKDAEGIWGELKRKISEKEYIDRGIFSVESSFLMASVFLGKKILFNESLTEYVIEGVKIPVPEEHKMTVKHLKEIYEKQLTIKK